MAFTGPQRQDLTAALTSAFTWATLQQAFQDHLFSRLDRITPNAAFNTVVENVLDWSQQHGWERAIARMASEARPDNAEVEVFVRRNREFPALLRSEDRERLRIGLSSVVKTVGDLRALLSTPLIAESPDFVDGAMDASSSELYLTSIIRWVDHFDRVSALIERALRRFPSHPVLESYARPLLSVVSARRPAGAGMEYTDPIEAYDLDGTLLIDRRPLRQAVRELSSGNLRVLAVGGASRSGKSHSMFFICHVAEKNQNFDAVVVDLSEEAAPATFEPHHMLRRILRRWGRNRLVDSIPQRIQSDSDARWVIDLADFLLAEAKESKRLLVLVLDGFANKNLNPLTRDLVGKLVNTAVREQLLRVVLLQYPEEVLAGRLGGRITAQYIEPFPRTELMEFLTAYAARSAHEEAPAASVDEILNDVLTNPTPSSNEEIAQRVDRWLRKLSAPQ